MNKSYQFEKLSLLFVTGQDRWSTAPDKINKKKKILIKTYTLNFNPTLNSFIH